MAEVSILRTEVISFLVVSEAERLNTLKIQAWISKELVDTCITCEEKTPNLMKMFGGVRCVKRTSSAVWRTPPRFSSLRKY
jgi:hypothetical protein